MRDKRISRIRWEFRLNFYGMWTVLAGLLVIICIASVANIIQVADPFGVFFGISSIYAIECSILAYFIQSYRRQIKSLPSVWALT